MPALRSDGLISPTWRRHMASSTWLGMAWKRMLSKLERTTRKALARRQGRSRSLELERLEDRTLLSRIIWDNEGGILGRKDPDRFEQYFCANAATARAIVRQAIRDWEQVI